MRFTQLVIFIIGMIFTTSSFANYDTEPEAAHSWVKKTFPKVSKPKLEQTIEAIWANSDSVISTELLLGLIAVESNFNPNVKSHMGAVGVTQVVPRFHRSKIKNRNLSDPKVSVEVGTKVLKECMVKHKLNETKALGCYSGHGSKSAVGKAYIKKVQTYKRKAKTYINANLKKEDAIKTFDVVVVP